MLIDINGDALNFLNDFIRYSKLHENYFAGAFWLITDEFRKRVCLLQKAIWEAEYNELMK